MACRTSSTGQTLPVTIVNGANASITSGSAPLAQDRNSLLSPAPDEDVFTMDPVDTRPNDPLWDELNRRFNILVAGFGGRPLLNQTKHVTMELVHRTLGRDWERFIAIRNQEDPDERLLNDYFKSLIGPGPEQIDLNLVAAGSRLRRKTQPVRQHQR